MRKTINAPTSAPAIVLLLICGALLASVILCAKFAIAAGLSVLDFAGVSTASAAVLLLLGRWRVIRATPPVGRTCAAQCAMLALSPLWTLAIGVGLGTERLRWRLVLGLLLGLAGVLVLTASHWAAPCSSRSRLRRWRPPPSRCCCFNYRRPGMQCDSARSRMLQLQSVPLRLR